MKPVIPLLSRAQPEERTAWMAHLSSELSNLVTVKAFEDLTDNERELTEVAIVANPDPANLRALPRLKWVQSLWAGVERLVTELPHDGPQIVRLADPQMAETMSEAVLAWSLYLHRDMPRYARQQKEKHWLEHPLKAPAERTIGILGLGKLGQAAALRLKDNGFQVAGWSRSEKDLDRIETYHGAKGLKTLLKRTDILILLMPLTEETHGLIDKEALALLPKGASLINFARGPLLDTDALRGALDDGHMSHAVLDVFDKEPLPEADPLWSHSKVTILPHISAPTTLATASKIVAENLGTFLKTGNIPESVDRGRGY